MTAAGSSRPTHPAPQLDEGAIRRIAGHHDLERCHHGAVESFEHLAESRGHPLEAVAHDADRAACGGLPDLLAGQGGEAKEGVGGQRVGRGSRVVEEVLAAHQELVGVGATREEAAAVGIVKQIDQMRGRQPGPLDPCHVVEFGQRQQRSEQRGIVLRVGMMGARDPPARSAEGVRRRIAARTPGTPQWFALRRASRPLEDGRGLGEPRANRAFHASRTLSSSPGRTRRARTSRRRGSDRSTAVGRGRVRSATWRMLPPSKFPWGVAPK